LATNYVNRGKNWKINTTSYPGLLEESHKNSHKSIRKVFVIYLERILNIPEFREYEMTSEKAEPTDSNISGLLFSVEERADCEIYADGDSLLSQRAQALLLLDEGATQKEASEQTGLTLGQTNYWLRKFRVNRMSAFPKFELTESLSDEIVSQPSEMQADQSGSQPDDELQLIEEGIVVFSPTESESDKERVLSDKKAKKGKKVKPKKKNKKNVKKKVTKKSSKKKREEKSVKPNKKKKKSRKKTKKSAKKKRSKNSKKKK